MTRYYKATDGTFTVFRATQSREYRSAWMTITNGYVSNMGFSSYPAHALRAVGSYEAAEIAKPEYQALVAAKMRRVTDDIEKAKAAGKPLSRYYDGGDPSDSWVRNADLMVEPAPVTGLPEVFKEAAPRVVQADPTKTTYLNLTQAYDYLNAELFAGKLPTCLVTLQRKANTRGYFAGARFASRDGLRKVDEIALNPATFKERDTREILSTLAHEMCHLEQHHFGKPAKGGYHNKEWGSMMHAIGLKPVSIDQPGKEVGNKVTHTIVDGGPYDLAAIALIIKQRVILDYVEAWTEEGKAKAAKKLKVKYSCPQCGINAWAKPDVRLICGDCDEAMEAEEG